MAQERAWAAMCVRSVDVHVSCSSHDDTQFAAFFIDPRAEGSTEMVCTFYFDIRARGVNDAFFHGRNITFFDNNDV